MRRLIRQAAMLVAISSLLAGCASAKAESFTLKVELLYASPDCDNDPECWLPTQSQPQLAFGESVANDSWPRKGDEVEIICQTTGETNQNYAGMTSNTWYGIKVPTEKIKSPSTQAKPVEDGVLGYVNAIWLAETTNQAPEC